MKKVAALKHQAVIVWKRAIFRVSFMEFVCLKTAVIATQHGAQSRLKIKKETAAAWLWNRLEIEPI